MNKYLRDFLNWGTPFMDAEGGASGAGGEGDEGEGGQNKTYTQEEVDKLLQSEADKRVTQALEKQRKKMEKQSLSNLDKEEREKREKELEIQDLKDQIKAMNELQTKNEVMKVLGARGLSTEFVDVIEIGDDVSKAQKRIDTLDRLIKKSVADEVKKRLGGKSPKNSQGSGITKEAFKKMSIAEQNELYTKDKEQYMKLLQGD